MDPQPPLREPESDNWDFFLGMPELDRRKIKVGTIRQQQVQQPLFEFSGACSGCGETPYLKLVTQLFGDRMVVANATGCSSIYGGNLPTTPWTQERDGRGPAWSQLALRRQRRVRPGFPRLARQASASSPRELLRGWPARSARIWPQPSCNAEQNDEADIYEQRERVASLKEKLQGMTTQPKPSNCWRSPTCWCKKSVWIVGGDGWAYDIGFGGLDHVLASGRNVNVLVLDTEVYSNTGGQMSKSTPRGGGREVRRGRQAGPQEGPRPDGDDLRQHLRRQRRDGREGRAHAESVPGSRSVRRAQR